jgi:hemerythrin
LLNKTINGITFELISNGIYHDREIVKIKQQDVFFYCYRSNSETGIWRLLVGQFYKGTVDYVTASFIHIDLQQHINNHHKHLPTETTDDIHSNVTKRDDGDDYYVTYDLLNDGTRVDNNDLFKPLQLCPSGTCFIKNDLKQKLEQIIKNTINDQTSKKLGLLLVEINQHNKYYETLLDIFNNKKQPSDKQSDKIKQLIDTFHVYMETYFIIDDSYCRNIGEYNFKFPKQDLTINHEFNEYRIINKTDDTQKYKLIVSKYSIHKNEGYFIINMVPDDSKINKFGLYDKICSAGIFISKLFEYTQQCNLSTSDKDSPVECKETYAYIGHYFQKAWPINQMNVIYENCNKKKPFLQSK